MRTKMMTMVALVALCGCEKPAPPSTVTDTPPTVPREPVPAVMTATPAPAFPPIPAIVTATPTPAPREFAPDGVFYLVAAASIETDSGIHGLTPGTGVRRVRLGVYVTPYGEAAIGDEKVTNDMVVARAARNSAVAVQAALHQRGTASAEAATEQSQAAEMNAAAASATAVQTAERVALTNKIAAMRAQRANVEAQVEVLAGKAAREQDGRDMGRSVSSNSSVQLATARAQLKLMRDQIRDAERDLRSMR